MYAQKYFLSFQQIIRDNFTVFDKHVPNLLHSIGVYAIVLRFQHNSAAAAEVLGRAVQQRFEQGGVLSGERSCEGLPFRREPGEISAGSILSAAFREIVLLYIGDFVILICGVTPLILITNPLQQRYMTALDNPRFF